MKDASKSQDDPARDENIGMIIDAVVSKFGADALSVVETQIAESEGEMRDVWEAIRARLPR